MKYSYILLLISLFLLSCNKPKSIISQFENKSKLYSDKTLPIEDVYVKMPSINNLTDSTLIITAPAMGYSSGKHLIYVISKKTGKIVKRVGPEGRGPEEMIAINNISTLNNEILFYDAMSRKILHYDYNKDSIRFQPLASHKKDFFRNLYIINDNRFLSCGVFGKNMYYYGDITTGEGSYFLEYPYLPGVSKEKQEGLALARSYAYSGAIIKHPELPKFVFYTGHAEYLQIIELYGDTVKEVIHFNFAPPIGKVIFKMDAYVWGTSKMATACFMNGTASNKYIYLLYSGKLHKENEFWKSKYIYIFDWQGNKIKRIELDNEVYGITVDKGDKEIFAYTTNDKTLKNEILHYTL
jgi:hypothetical protein